MARVLPEPGAASLATTESLARRAPHVGARRRPPAHATALRRASSPRPAPAARRSEAGAHALARRSDRGSGRASSSTCATRHEGRSGPLGDQPVRHRAGELRGALATGSLRDRSPGPWHRGTARGLRRARRVTLEIRRHHAPQPRRRAAPDRGHELRRGRAPGRPGRTRTIPPSRSCSSRPNSSPRRRALLARRRPRAAGEEHPWLAHALLGEGGPRIRDRPRALHRPRGIAPPRRSRSARPLRSPEPRATCSIHR